MQKLPVSDDLDKLLEKVNLAVFSRARPGATPLSYATSYLWHDGNIVDIRREMVCPGFRVYGRMKVEGWFDRNAHNSAEVSPQSRRQIPAGRLSDSHAPPSSPRIATPASRHTTAGSPPGRTAVKPTSTKLVSETLAAPLPFSEHSVRDGQDQR
jgi:hypothetical protein